MTYDYLYLRDGGLNYTKFWEDIKPSSVLPKCVLLSGMLPRFAVLKVQN